MSRYTAYVTIRIHGVVQHVIHAPNPDAAMARLQRAYLHGEKIALHAGWGPR